MPKEELLTNLSILNVLAILGVRRSGKSTLSLLKTKLRLCRFDDERLRNLKSDDLHIVEQAIYELYGNVDYKKIGIKGA